MLNNTFQIPHAKPTFYYVDAHAGSGKTYSAHKFIASQNTCFTIATQTNELSDQQELDLRELGLNASVIKQKLSTDNCTKKYIRHCTDKRSGVVLINQKVALQELKDAARQNLIVDEFPSPVTKLVLTEDIKATRAFISDLIEVKPSEFDGFLEIVDTDRIAEIAEFGKKRTSTIHTCIIELCKKVHSSHQRSFVAESNYIRFRSGLPDAEGVLPEHDDSKKRLVIYTFIQPSILNQYRSVTFMGANFVNSKLFAYWQDKVNWLPHPYIKGERYEDFTHKAPAIDLYHLSEDILSWTHLDKRIGYDHFVDSVAEVIGTLFPGQDHIVTMSAKADQDWKLENGTVISPNPVGLNAYMDKYLAVHLAPLMPSNMDYAIWNAVAGLTDGELVVAQMIELQYQFFTRSAVRDGKDHRLSNQRLVFIGLDRATVQYVGMLFGVQAPSRLIDVPALSGYVKPPRKTRADKKSDAEKKLAQSEASKRYRARMKAAAKGE